LLADTLFGSHSETPGNVTIHEEPEVESDIPWPLVTESEMTRAITEADANKAVGEDGTSLKFIKALWATLKEQITMITQASIALSHHPSSFKSAVIAILRKRQSKRLHDS
jgi:hypothetical protein